MGYIPGQGIGKDGTGIAEPISESANKGRLGLGYILEGLEREDVKWELEDVSYILFSGSMLNILFLYCNPK